MTVQKPETPTQTTRQEMLAAVERWYSVTENEGLLKFKTDIDEPKWDDLDILESISRLLSDGPEAGKEASGPSQTTAALDAFEHSADRAFHIGLARRCLAAVPDNCTEDQLDGIGRRARHWVLKAAREHMLKESPHAN